MILNKYQLQLQIENRANEIRASMQFHPAIVKHGSMLKDTYNNHPLFYKILFRNSRFIISTTIISIYYNQSAAALKDIKSFFKGKGIISENSLDSFLFFLRVGRRLEVERTEQDKRQLLFRPTASALKDIHALISSMALPYQTLLPDVPVETLLELPWFLPVFFKAYGQLMLQEVYLIDLVPQSALFISKDAGHMVLLMLFMESIQHNSHLLLLSSVTIAKFCAVSRAHVNRILLSAEKAGLLTTTNNVLIELNSSFFVMVERYFSLYLAMVGYGMDSVWGQYNAQAENPEDWQPGRNSQPNTPFQPYLSKGE